MGHGEGCDRNFFSISTWIQGLHFKILPLARLCSPYKLCILYLCTLGRTVSFPYSFWEILCGFLILSQSFLSLSCKEMHCGDPELLAWLPQPSPSEFTNISPNSVVPSLSPTPAGD